MKTILILFVLSLFSLSQTMEAQKKGEHQTSNKSDIVKNIETIFYYGVDFSHVRVSDGPKVSRSLEYSKVYPSAWIAYLEKEMVHNGYIQGVLRKKGFYYKQDEIYAVSIKVVPNFIIGQRYSFTFDTIKNAIKEYDLHQKSGVGLVLIPEVFNKPEENAKTWIVFFDIQSREILWSTKVTGNCKHMGYTAHWGSGVIDGFKDFIRNKYR